MAKTPLFFRDQGEMGDVLAEARGLVSELKTLKKNASLEKKAIEDYKEKIEETRYLQSIKERLGKKVEGVKNLFAKATKEWLDYREKLKKREKELKMQQEELLRHKKEIESKLESRLAKLESEQKESLNKELQNLSELSNQVNYQLIEINTTKNAIEEILKEDEEIIKEKLLSKEDVQFMQLNYFNLIKERLASNGVTNPLTGQSYSSKDWNITLEKNALNASIVEGLISKKIPICFDIRILVSESKEGFIYKKIGMEITDIVTDFINASTHGLFHSLVLVSPTGWTEGIIEKVKNISDMNNSVYLVDLFERQIFYNEIDKKTKTFAEWFAPISLTEEILELITKLKQNIENGELQFRADKVANRYQIPRKVVVGAFREMEESGIGEIIDTTEGAKDLIFFVRD